MDDDKAWFHPKSHGYGAGLPISWQGWAVLLGYIGFAIVMALLMEANPKVGLPLGIAGMVLATIVVLAIARRRTRGGWRWRWGEDE